jgi:RNase P subunit RPR2
MKAPRVDTRTSLPLERVRVNQTYLCVPCRVCGETIPLMGLEAGASLLAGAGGHVEIAATCPACGDIAGYLLNGARGVQA